MKVRCEQFEEIVERQDAAELAALEQHAGACEVCALQLKLEREISSAAPGLRKEWESPDLWARIERGMEAEPRSRGVLAFPQTWMGQWRLAAAAVVLLVATTAATWLALNEGVIVDPPAGQVVIDHRQRLLTEQTMDEVEKAEAAYIQSIDRLAALAAPRLQKADSALLSNYREKLVVLDAAIAEIRAQADGNRFNAHLRKELLSAYQAKQQTLQQLNQEEVR